MATTVTLQWDVSAGATTYWVCIDKTNNNACDTAWLSVGAAQSATFNDLAAGTTYYWQVEAQNGSTFTAADAGAWRDFFTQSAVVPASFAKLGPLTTFTGINPTLTWQQSAGATNYQYCVDAAPDPAPNDCDSSWVSVGTSLSVSLRGLTGGGTYLWQARAQNASGITEATNGWATITSTFPSSSAFGKTSPAEGATVAPGLVPIAYTPSATANYYAYCVDPIDNNSCDQPVGFTGQFFVIGGVHPTISIPAPESGTRYFWQLAAVTLGQQHITGADAGLWHSFNTSSADGKPGGFWKTASTPSGSTVTLAWATSFGATGYEYCLDTVNNSSCDDIWRAPTGSPQAVPTSTVISGLAAATTYFWQVRAINANGSTNADSGSWRSFATSAALPAAFGKSSPGNGAGNQPAALTLTWGTSTQATSYRVCLDLTNDDGCDFGWLALSDLSLALRGLGSGKTYSWQVDAENATGVTAADNRMWWTFTTPATAPPGAFNKVSPVDTAIDQPVSFNLQWAASSGATQYRYCVDTTANSACDTVWVPVGTDLTALLIDLTPATTYYWQVEAVNGAGTTAASGGWWSFTTTTCPTSVKPSSTCQPPLRLEFDVAGAPLPSSINIGQTKKLFLRVKCLDQDDQEVPNCNWEVTIAVAPGQEYGGGHLASSNGTLDIHDPACRPIGAMVPSEAESTPGCESSVHYRRTTSAIVDLFGFFTNRAFLYVIDGSDPFLLEPQHPVAGSVKFTASCVAPSACGVTEQIVELAAPLIAVPDSQYLVVRGKRPQHGHIDNQYATPVLKEFLEKAGVRFSSLLEAAGFVPVQRPRMVITDLSLKAGGLYDVEGSGSNPPPAGRWVPPHKGHRWGDNADVRVNYKVFAGETPETLIPLTENERRLVQRLLHQAFIAAWSDVGGPLQQMPDLFPVKGEEPDSSYCAPASPTIGCPNHWHVVLRGSGSSGNATAIQRIGNSSPAAMASLLATSTNLGGGLHGYEYTLTVPGQSGSAVDGFALRLGGNITAVAAPAGWVATVVQNTDSTNVVFTANGNDVDSNGVNANGVQVGQSLSGFSFVSTVPPGTVTFRASGYIPWSPMDEDDAEDLAEAGTISTPIEGSVVGPPPGASTLTAQPMALSYAGLKGGAAGPLISVTPPKTVTVGYSGASPSWNVTSDEPWLAITGGVGTGAGQFTVAVINPGNVIGGATQLSGTIRITSATAEPLTIPVTLTIQQDPAANLISNGDFSNGVVGWQQFATPDMSYIVSNVVNGVFEYYRVPPPQGTTNQAVVFRETGFPVPIDTPLLAQFDLGNSSSVRKRLSVLILDSNFSDLSVCTFWIPANSPLQTYQMQTHTTKAWTNAAIYFYAATAGSNGGAYRLDNVSLQYAPGESASQTECFDPNVPGPPGGLPEPDLLVNGDFGTGSLPPWQLFGQITSQILNGVFEFIRTPGTPAGVVFQSTGQAMSVNQIMTATFDLGNSSTVRKRVTVIMHDSNFSDLSACTFWIQPGQPLSSYVMRTYATQAWANATLSVYAATVGADQWIRLDNATFRRTPGTAITGTECVEPSATAMGVSGSHPLAAPVDRGRVPVAVPFAGAIDLTQAGRARLQFTAGLAVNDGWVDVQVRTAGSEWVTIGMTPLNDVTTWLEIDLEPFLGKILEVRFVLHGVDEAIVSWRPTFTTDVR